MAMVTRLVWAVPRLVNSLPSTPPPPHVVEQKKTHSGIMSGGRGQIGPMAGNEKNRAIIPFFSSVYIFHALDNWYYFPTHPLFCILVGFIGNQTLCTKLGRALPPSPEVPAIYCPQSWGFGQPGMPSPRVSDSPLTLARCVSFFRFLHHTGLT